MRRITSIRDFYLIYLGVLSLLVACGGEPSQPEEKVVLTEVKIDLQDSITRKILDAQDRFQIENILPFFSNPDPTYRYLAARAFASLKDPAGLDSLIAHLQDPIREVRKGAAFALGQIGDPRAETPLISAF